MIKKNESPLDKESRHTTTLTAENVLRLAWLSQGEGFACGQTSAQWNALRYFGRANGPSRTLLAFADYHATTRGTGSIVSQGPVFYRFDKNHDSGRIAKGLATDQFWLVHQTQKLVCWRILCSHPNVRFGSKEDVKPLSMDCLLYLRKRTSICIR